MRAWRRAFPAVVAVILALLSRLWTIPQVELDERAILYPAQRFASLIGRAPQLAPDLRLLVMDDQSIKGAKEMPSIDELGQAARRLLDAGFDTVLISGVILEASAKLPTAGLAAGKTVGVGGVAYPTELKWSLTQPIADYGLDYFLKATDDPGDRAVAASLLAPRYAQGEGVVRYGALNNDNDARAPAAFQVAPGRILPHLALLAHAGFLADPDGFLAGARDEKLYVDFLPLEAVTGPAVRLGPILQGEPLPKKLQGGKVALIVLDGHTGSRFVRSPFGNVPSYVAMASLVSSNMLGKPLLGPTNPGLFKPLCIVVLIALVTFGRTRYRLLLGGLWIACCGVAAIFLTFALKRFVPGASTVVIMSAAWAAAAFQESLQTFAARVKLGVELDMGSAVQKLLLPEGSTWKFGKWRINVAHKPYGALSGDWYQVFVPQGDASFAVVAIGDVVGKGTSAALITAGIATLWHDFAVDWERGELDLDAFLARLDHVILASFKNQQYTTLCLAVLRDGEATLVNCASPQWLVVKEDWSSAAVRAKASPPLGMRRPENSKEFRTVLKVEPGATLVAYTDGLIDGSKARVHLSGRLKRLGQANVPFSPEALTREIWQPLPPELAPMPDDATTLLLSYER